MKEHVGIMDITRAVNLVLKENFPKISRESAEVKEGFKLPSFFSYVKPLRFSHESEYYKRLQVLVVIKYFSETGKRIENTRMADELTQAFGIILKVPGEGRDRFLKLNDVSADEDKEGTLSFSFSLDFMTFLKKEEVNELMENIEIEHIKERLNGNSD